MKPQQIRACTECDTEFHGREDYLLYGTRWRLSSDNVLWFDCHCGNTLQLPAQEASWFSPSLFMSEKASKIYSSLGGSLKLPRISPQILKLQQSILNPNTNSNQIAQILKKDPFISGRIVQFANNLSPQNSISTLEHAVGYIGRDFLSEFLMTVFLKQIPFQTQVYKPLQFWEEACLKAHITQRLVQDFGEKIPQDPWLFGSLRDIGKIVGSVLIPQQLDQLIETMNNPKTQDSWGHIETSLNLPQHKVLGEIGTMIWGFPETLKSVILFTPDTESTPSQLKLEEAIAVANEAAYWLLLEPHRIDPDIMAWALKTLNMSEDSFTLWLKKGPDLLAISKKEAKMAASNS